MFCGKCGMQNSDDNDFCNDCGCPLPHSASAHSSVGGLGRAITPSPKHPSVPVDRESAIPGFAQASASDVSVGPRRTLDPYTPVGVGGWLAVYCCALILGIIVIAALIPSSPGITGLLQIATGALGLFTAIRLCTNDPNALAYVKSLLIVQFVVGAFDLISAGASEQGIRFPFYWGHIPSFLSSILAIAATAIWYAYFSTSKRIWATYGKNL